MAKKKIGKTKTSRVELPVTMEQPMPTIACPRVCRMSKTAVIAIALGICIIGLVAFNRGLIVAAIVNGKPIFRSSVNRMVMARYGTQTMENMITEQLITDEAKKLNVVVTSAEIDAKEQEILASFGGNVTLEEVLSYQGMTKQDFDQQIKLQMLLTKIIGKDVTITDDQIAKYITDNPSTLVATDSEGMKKEAKEALLAEQVSAKLQAWYAALKEKSKVIRFMK